MDALGKQQNTLQKIEDILRRIEKHLILADENL